MELQELQKILMQNSDKNFVQRILLPNDSPKLDLGNGDYATHKMAWTTIDNKPIVFPTVIQQGNVLKELPIHDAVTHALKNNEYIPFQTPESANQFSSEYKKVWQDPSQQNPIPIGNSFMDLMNLISAFAKQK